MYPYILFSKGIQSSWISAFWLSCCVGVDLPGERLEQEGGGIHTQRCCHTLTEPVQSSTAISCKKTSQLSSSPITVT